MSNYLMLDVTDRALVSNFVGSLVKENLAFCRNTWDTTEVTFQMNYWKDKLSDNDGQIVTEWGTFKRCYFARKEWVNPREKSTPKSYEEGDFLRVWCEHDGCWCQALISPDYCPIFQDHEAE